MGTVVDLPGTIAPIGQPHAARPNPASPRGFGAFPGGRTLCDVRVWIGVQGFNTEEGGGPRRTRRRGIAVGFPAYAEMANNTPCAVRQLPGGHTFATAWKRRHSPNQNQSSGRPAPTHPRVLGRRGRVSRRKNLIRPETQAVRPRLRALVETPPSSQPKPKSGKPAPTHPDAPERRDRVSRRKNLMRPETQAVQPRFRALVETQPSSQGDRIWRRKVRIFTSPPGRGRAAKRRG